MIFCIAFVLRKNKMKGYGISRYFRVLFSLLSILIHFKPLCHRCACLAVSLFLYIGMRGIYLFQLAPSCGRVPGKSHCENKLGTLESKKWKTENFKLNFSSCFKMHEKGQKIHIALPFPTLGAARNQYAGCSLRTSRQPRVWGCPRQCWDT